MAEVKQIKIEAVGLKDIKRELDDIKKSMKEATDPKEMAKLTKEADKLEKQLKDVNDKVKEFDLDDKLKEASSAADPLARAIEEVTNEMKELDDASKDVGTNFEKLTNSQIASELSSVAGGFTSIATSAYALSDALGLTNDDTEDFIKNIGTGLAVANGFGQGLQGIISAQKLLASTTIASTTATKGGTVAMRIFNGVVKANPIGILVTALAAAVSAFALFNSSSKDAKENTEDLERANDELNKTLQEQNKIFDKNVELRNTQRSIRDSRRQLLIEKDILDAENKLVKLKRDSPDDIEEIIKAQERLNKLNVDLMEEQHTTALSNLKDDNEVHNEKMNHASEQMKKFKEGTKEYAYWNDEYEKYLDLNISYLDRKGVLELKQANESLKLQHDNAHKLAEIRKNNKKDEEKTEEENVNYIKALRDQLRAREAVAEIQHRKQLELMDADLIQDEEKRAAKILEINKKYKDEEIKALTELTKSTEKVLDEQEKIDLEKAGKNAEERKLIEEKYAADVAQIYRDLAETKNELEAGTFEKIKEGAEEAEEAVEDLEEILSNLSDIILRTAENLDSSFGAGLASGIEGISEFIALSEMEFEDGMDKVTAYAAAAANAISGILSAVQDANRKALEETLSDTEAATNEQIDLINKQVEAGVLSVEAGEEAKIEINKKAEATMLAAKKKAFEEDKKYQIAQAIIAGVQGSLQAFTSAMSLPFPAGPIVGGVMAAAVAAMTAINVSKIKATKFNSGGSGGGAAAPKADIGSSAPARQAPIVNFQGTGGNDNEVYAGGNPNITIENSVSVSETEITDKQKTVHSLATQSQL